MKPRIGLNYGWELRATEKTEIEEDRSSGKRSKVTGPFRKRFGESEVIFLTPRRAERAFRRKRLWKRKGDKDGVGFEQYWMAVGRAEETRF